MARTVRLTCEFHGDICVPAEECIIEEQITDNDQSIGFLEPELVIQCGDHFLRAVVDREIADLILKGGAEHEFETV